MALWTGLGQAATVAQLVGADVGGLISMIMQAALTARQNRKECEQLARRVLMIAQLLPHVQDPEAAQQLAGLGDTLRDAHELVVSCQGRSAAYQLIMAGRQAERFREVQSRIDFYLILFPVISHIGITRRLERIYNVLVQQDDSTRADPSQFPQPSPPLQEVVPHGTQEFTFAEILAATNNFSLDTLIGQGGFGSVNRGRLHRTQEFTFTEILAATNNFSDTLIGQGGFGSVNRGRLHDGREVAVKRMNLQSSNSHEEFHAELNSLARIRHKHIIRLLGSCVQTVSNDKRLQASTLQKKKGLLRRRTKKPEQPEMLIVYEYMQNGSLLEHLHPDHGSSELSPVTLSWKMRIDVLLGVSRAIEHMQCHANPQIIHRDIKSSNILLDANWVPHVSDFGLSVAWDMASDESELEVPMVVGTYGYMAPEYTMNGRLSRASDVYSLGSLMLELLTGKNLGFFMLELLTGKNASSQGATFETSPIVPDFLDRRPVPEPTPWQLQALKRVAWTARCCVRLDAKDRLAISDAVANLEMAHELICRDEPGPVDEPDLFDELPDSPHSRSFPSAWYHYESEPEVLE